MKLGSVEQLPGAFCLTRISRGREGDEVGGKGERQRERKCHAVMLMEY